jgi:hypothetical protein
MSRLFVDDVGPFLDTDAFSRYLLLCLRMTISMDMERDSLNPCLEGQGYGDGMRSDVTDRKIGLEG